MKAVVIGAGPSLTRGDCQLVHEWRAVLSQERIVITANCAYQAMPWPDFVYGGDNGFWDAYVSDILVHCRGARLFSINTGPHEKYGTEVLRLDWPPDYGSGMQAVRLAEHLGAEAVALLGFDWGADPDTGRKHFHDDHSYPLANNVDFSGVAHSFFRVPVTNCSRRTALDWFPCMELEQWLLTE